MRRSIDEKSPLTELPFRLTLTETARLIRVSPGFLSRMCMKGFGPPHRRLGREYVIARDALLCWMAGLDIDAAEGLLSGVDAIRQRIKEAQAIMSATNVGEGSFQPM